MKTPFSMQGLIPAAFTPMREDCRINLDAVPAVVDNAVRTKVSALFVCGTTGESASLTTPERKAVLEAFIAASGGRMPIIAHVGHASIADSRELAAHAQDKGAVAISAYAPFFFRPGTVAELVNCMAVIADAAPELPFYYYHIPHMTGVSLDMVEFLRQGGPRIPTLAGIKYTAPTLYEFQSCAALENGRFNMLFGTDEMLIAALAAGAKGAVGSTYNIAAPLYHEIIRAFNAGEIEKARELQLVSVRLVEVAKQYRPLPALKAMMEIACADCGPTRLPLVAMSRKERDQMKTELEARDFVRWMR